MPVRKRLLIGTKQQLLVMDMRRVPNPDLSRLESVMQNSQSIVRWASHPSAEIGTSRYGTKTSAHDCQSRNYDGVS